MNKNHLISKTRGAAVLGFLLVGGVFLPDVVHAQGSLPDPPPGFVWESQGVMVYADSDAFTVDLGQNGAAGASSQVELNETISLTLFDSAAGPNEHVVVHSSSYAVSLAGTGSVVVINLDGGEQTFNGAAGLNSWVISGGGAAGATSNGFTNSGALLGAASAGLFDDGGAIPVSSLNVNLADSGVAPTTGANLDFNFDGTYDVNIASTGSNGQWFGSGTAYGNASLQTVYERFDLVAVVPEPSSFLMIVLGGALLGMRRLRR